MKVSKFVCYSVPIDENTDICDTAQLTILIIGIDKNFNITEEMATLFRVKAPTTKRVDFF